MHTSMLSTPLSVQFISCAFLGDPNRNNICKTSRSMLGTEQVLIKGVYFFAMYACLFVHQKWKIRWIKMIF